MVENCLARALMRLASSSYCLGLERKSQRKTLAKYWITLTVLSRPSTRSEISRMICVAFLLFLEMVVGFTEGAFVVVVGCGAIVVDAVDVDGDEDEVVSSKE